ncbi:MAG: DUF5615 family PIN-like protein [Lacipirellulaceae bacterium]
MDLLLDQGLPRGAIACLVEVGIRSQHVAELGMAASSDEAILQFARDQELVVVSLDSDFHTLLATSGASSPSVIRIRVEGLRSDALAELLRRVLDTVANELDRGAIASVTQQTVRVRSLPIGAKPR